MTNMDDYPNHARRNAYFTLEVRRLQGMITMLLSEHFSVHRANVALETTDDSIAYLTFYNPPPLADIESFIRKHSTCPPEAITVTGDKNKCIIRLPHRALLDCTLALHRTHDRNPVTTENFTSEEIDLLIANLHVVKGKLVSSTIHTFSTGRRIEPELTFVTFPPLPSQNKCALRTGISRMLWSVTGAKTQPPEKQAEKDEIKALKAAAQKQEAGAQLRNIFLSIPYKVSRKSTHLSDNNKYGGIDSYIVRIGESDIPRVADAVKKVFRKEVEKMGLWDEVAARPAPDQPPAPVVQSPAIHDPRSLQAPCRI